MRCFGKKAVYREDTDIRSKYFGTIEHAASFITERQLLDSELWERFASQFGRGSDDGDLGWRGEYWGKMMRGGVLVYRYTRDARLYSALEKAVVSLLSREDEQGRIATYSAEHEFSGWDLWCRKYVLLGLEYFYDICTDRSLKDRILGALRRSADYILAFFGPGKRCLAEATANWRGLNSSSILEPMVKLYGLTEDERYLDFSGYIVESGCTTIADIFQLAYEDKLYPYQYPVTKAYEMMSCFQGLLEYYKYTGDERHRTAVLNFAEKVAESDITVIGSAGCTHELFDHSAVRQTQSRDIGIMQETCVTVTWMLLCHNLLLMTGDAKWADRIEKSFYNAYLGSLNTGDALDREAVDNTLRDGCSFYEPLPFDSYSPLTPGRRGRGIGGLKLMSDGHYYGCCACIGSAGLGAYIASSVMSYDMGIAVNMYNCGSVETKTPNGRKLKLTIDTDFPISGRIKIKIGLEEPEKFSIKLRIPEYAEAPMVTLNGKSVAVRGRYAETDGELCDGDEISIDFGISVIAALPTRWESSISMTGVIWKYDYTVPVYDEPDSDAFDHIAFSYGPLQLGADSSLGRDIREKISAPFWDGEAVSAKLLPQSEIPYRHIAAFRLALPDGDITLTDYASVGKSGGFSECCAWLPVKRRSGK